MKTHHLLVLAVVLVVGYFIGTKYPTILSSVTSKITG